MKTRLLTLFAATLAVLALISQSADKVKSMPTSKPAPGLERAVFGGGCFWCVEAIFERLDGVQDVTSGSLDTHFVPFVARGSHLLTGTRWLRLRTNVLQGSSTQQQLFQRAQGSGADLLFFFSY